MIIGGLLSKLVEVAQLGFFNRILGAIFGFVKYLIIIGLLIKFSEFMGIAAGFSGESKGKKSELYEPVRKITDFCLRWTWDKVPPVNQLKDHQKLDLFKEV